MTTGMTYAQFKTQIATLAVVDETDTNFVIIFPQAITYAENRMYRDLDLLSTVLQDSTKAFTANNRNVSVSIATFVTLQQVNVVTPYGTTDPDQGTRNPLNPVTKEYLDNQWPNVTGATVPTDFAMINQSKFIVGPWPDQAYQIELIGTYRPDSLSATNTTTPLSLYWPEMMTMAAMIYISGFQRNFGRANDDPQMAVTYESQYQALLKSAMVEEARKKFQSAAWSSMEPATVATPTRG